MTDPAAPVNVTEALTVNANVSSTDSKASLSSSSSSCISSASPTSSFGSCSISSSESQATAVKVGAPLINGINCTNGDDSANNGKTVSSDTPSTGNNVSGELVISDNDQRDQSDDIISHLNMLSMQDAVGFNGFGLLGSGINTGSGTNVWTGMSARNDGVNSQNGNCTHAQDQAQLGLVNYIEAVRLQQLKSVLNNDMVANYFTNSAQSTNSAAIFAGGSLQQNQLRRPLSGIGGGGTMSYGPHFGAAGIRYPPPIDFSNQVRALSTLGNRSSPFLGGTGSDQSYFEQYSSTPSIQQGQQPKAPASSFLRAVGMQQQSGRRQTSSVASFNSNYGNGPSSMFGGVGTYPSRLTAFTASSMAYGIDGPQRYSRRVFAGGLPPDIDEDEICASFSRFGPVVVDWPHKAESKSYFPPKGYAFLIFQLESSVQALIDSCIQQDGRYYMCVSSPTMREKAVQIRPWRLADADFVLDPNLPLDPRKTVFVGGVPRPLKATELAAILERLFGGVCYTGIDTDPELKYPKGAARVSFSNQQSYIAAIAARFVQLQHGDIDKRVEIKPYVLDDQMCDECGGARCGGKYAPYFCANVGCLQYYCELCWQHVHNSPGRDFHKPLVKEGNDRPRTVSFKCGM